MSRINFAMFIFGLTLGSVATWFCLRKRYDHIAQEEIDSVKAAFAERKSEIDAYNAIIKNYSNKETTNHAKHAESSYTNYASASAKKEEIKMSEKPYIISPEEFGNLDDYDQISLTYYSDGVLVDDEYDIVEDIDGIVGADFSDHFGDYEDDSVFVRNDRLKCDYEILRDNRSWEDTK